MKKTGRVYKIGKRMMEIPLYLFAEFAKWQTRPDALHDKKFVSTLLLALTEENKLIDGDFSPDVMDFVKSMIIIYSFGILYCYCGQNVRKKLIHYFVYSYLKIYYRFDAEINWNVLQLLQSMRMKYAKKSVRNWDSTKFTIKSTSMRADKHHLISPKMQHTQIFVFPAIIITQP